MRTILRQSKVIGSIDIQKGELSLSPSEGGEIELTNIIGTIKNSYPDISDQEIYDGVADVVVGRWMVYEVI